MPQLLGALLLLAIAALQLWTTAHALRSGRAPVFWWTVAVERRTRPRLYAALMSAWVLATAAVVWVCGAIAWVLLRG